MTLESIDLCQNVFRNEYFYKKNAKKVGVIFNYLLSLQSK